MYTSVHICRRARQEDELNRNPLLKRRTQRTCLKEEVGGRHENRNLAFVFDSISAEDRIDCILLLGLLMQEKYKTLPSIRLCIQVQGLFLRYS